MEWVERNGPWNFDNNLLLLCRWTKELSVNNISFTHSPFWIQVWGLPFESMSKEVGRDLGSKIGEYIETDKRSWLSEQAKFMRIRVDLPINKPLRRGGNIINSDGEKYWVSFNPFQLGLCKPSPKRTRPTGTDTPALPLPPTDRADAELDNRGDLIVLDDHRLDFSEN
nr:uncharacterized protein CFP56_25294 [Quercus suber]